MMECLRMVAEVPHKLLIALEKNSGTFGEGLGQVT